MGIKKAEQALLAELRVIAADSAIKMRDVMEWSTGEVKTEKGETHYYLPVLRVHVAVKKGGG